MSEITREVNWPPKRRRFNDENRPGPQYTPADVGNPQDRQPPSTPLQSRQILQLPTPSNTPNLYSADKKQRPRLQNGFLTTPKEPSWKRYALQNPGYSRKKPFQFSDFRNLEPMSSLSKERWTELAHKHGILKEKEEVKPFQAEAANTVLARKQDLCLIAPTGAGKSLVWALPLVAQGFGISLVIVPFTTLGHQGASNFKNTDIISTYIHDEDKSDDILAKIAQGNAMHIVYACVEMLETPRLARVLHSASFQAQLSAVYVDEAHEVHESHSWRPGYANLHLLRRVIGTGASLVGISATLPTLYRKALETYAGVRPDYHLVNLGNHRPELVTIIANMQHDISSFRDLEFLIPDGAQSPDDIQQTIIYTDDLERLTAMFWKYHDLLVARGLSPDLVDILHAGLSKSHQQKCSRDFGSGRTRLLFGSAKIGSGVHFPAVERVVQYCCRDLTLVKWAQRHGRGGRKGGATAVGIIFVERSMTGDDGQLSVASPKFEDPGLLDLIHSISREDRECVDSINDRWLENPPRNSSQTRCLNRCSNCDPSLLRLIRPNRLEWIMEDPSESSTSRRRLLSAPKKPQQASILDKLKAWRFQLWEQHWKDTWKSYGPDSLINDADLVEISSHLHLISSSDDLYSRTHILHFEDIAPALLQVVHDLRLETYGVNALVPPLPVGPSAGDTRPPPPSTSYDSISWVHAAADGTVPNESEPESISQGKKRKADDLAFPGMGFLSFN